MTSTIQQALSWLQPVSDDRSISQPDVAVPGPRNAEHGQRNPIDQDKSAFSRLPDVVIETVLLHSDPETFVSLSLLNRQWHAKSGSALLCAFHLTKLLSSTEGERAKWEALRHEELPRLRRTLAREARRRMFPAYRPKQTSFKFVVEPTISPTSAPHGESLRFWLSRRDNCMVVSSSTHLYLVDIRGAVPEVTKQVRLQHRSTAVALSEDHQKLAVLSSETRLNLYELCNGSFKLFRSCMMEEAAKALSFSPDATVLATAGAHAIEIIPASADVSLNLRRRLPCQDVDNIYFSSTGTTIVGTSVRASSSCTVVVNVSESMDAIMDDDEDSDRRLVDIWTSQPLFPESFKQTTHAVPLQNDASTLVAYDGPARLFGLLNSKDVQFNHPILPLPPNLASFAAPLPAINEGGDLVSVGLNGSGIHFASIPEAERPEDAEPPPTFFKPTTHKYTGLQWVSRGRNSSFSQSTHRLVGVRSTATMTSAGADLFASSADFGYIDYLDLDCHVDVAKDEVEIIVELPCMCSEGLSEDESSMEQQAASINSTVKSRDGNRMKNMPIARSVTSARRRGQGSQTRSHDPTPVPAANVPGQGSPNVESLAPEEIHLDDPYTVGQPRSRATLQRAATAAANNRRRPLSATLEQFVLRRTNGRSEVPDESDADNWVPPPPQYSKHAENELPDRLNRMLLPRSRSPFGRLTTSSPSLLLDQTKDSESTTQAQARQRDAQAPLQNARQPIASGVQGIRHALSGPIGSHPATRSTEAFPTFGSSDATTSGQLETPERPGTAPLTRPRLAQPAARPASMAVADEPKARRPSVLRRPISVHATTMFSRKGSQPEPISTSPSIPPPESPAAPSPTQVESLHRRHTSGSISSLRSEGGTVAPTAARGAHRRTPGTSPWSSQLMLMSVSENESANRDDIIQTNGNATVLPSPTTQSDSLPNGNENALPSQLPPGVRREKTQSKRLSRFPGALSTIDSISSVVTSVRSKTPGRPSDESGNKQSKPTQLSRHPSNPRRKPSQKLQRGSSKLQHGSSRAKRSNTVKFEENKKQNVFQRIKRAVWKNLNKV